MKHQDIWRKSFRVMTFAAAVMASSRETLLVADSYSTRGKPQQVFSSGVLTANNTVTNQTMYTPSVQGMYRVACYSQLSNNVAGSSGNWNISFHSVSTNGLGYGVTGPTQNLNAANGTTSTVGPLYFISGANAITYNLTFGAPTGAPTVTYACALEQM